MVIFNSYVKLPEGTSMTMETQKHCPTIACVACRRLFGRAGNHHPQRRRQTARGGGALHGLQQVVAVHGVTFLAVGQGPMAQRGPMAQQKGKNWFRGPKKGVSKLAFVDGANKCRVWNQGYEMLFSIWFI